MFLTMLLRLVLCPNILRIPIRLFFPGICVLSENNAVYLVAGLARTAPKFLVFVRFRKPASMFRRKWFYSNFLFYFLNTATIMRRAEISVFID